MVYPTETTLPAAGFLYHPAPKVSVSVLLALSYFPSVIMFTLSLAYVLFSRQERAVIPESSG